MARKGSSDQQSVVVRNRKAKFRYELQDRLECGISLKGTEVKSLRQKEASLEEAYAVISEQGELWLHGCHIKPYAQDTSGKHEPIRPRKLLARRAEIRKWQPQVKQKGLTIVPLDIHFNSRGLAKVTLALARGKAQADKRRELRKKDHQREMDRAMRK